MNETIISAKDFRLHFTKYIDLVAAGQSFIVVKRSKPVIRLLPPDRKNVNEKEEKLNALLACAGSFADIDEKEWTKNIKNSRKTKRRKIDFINSIRNIAQNY